jgi:hypothetical protein
MRNSRKPILVLVALLTAGMAQAQDAPGSPDSGESPQAICLVDDHLSLWLSLEAADRMIAALESEHRDVSEELAKHQATLKLMVNGKAVSSGFTMTRLGVLRTTESGSQESLEADCGRLEARLAELNKTLKRRRAQRDRLEEWLGLLLGIEASDGS